MAGDSIAAMIRVPDPEPVATAFRPAFLDDEAFKRWVRDLWQGHHAIYCVPGAGLLSISFQRDNDTGERLLKIDAAVGRGLVKYIGLLDELARIGDADYIEVDAIGKAQRRLFMQHGFIPVAHSYTLRIITGYGRQ